MAQGISVVMLCQTLNIKIHPVTNIANKKYVCYRGLGRLNKSHTFLNSFYLNFRDVRRVVENNSKNRPNKVLVRTP